MAAIPVVKAGEVYLGGYRFPIRGKVRVANISVTPNPIAFGDTSRQGDTQVMSQLIQTSLTGGSGIHKANPRTEIERFWTSEAETRFRNLICLPPLTYDLDKPSGLTTEDCLLTHEYKTFQYFIFAGGKIYRWNNSAATFNDNGTATGGWSALLETLVGNPTDSTIFKDYLYIAQDTGMEKMLLAGSESLTAVAGAAKLVQVWDEKLWKVYDDSGVWTTANTQDGGADVEAWTAGAVFPSGIVPTQLTTFRNVTGDEVLACLTNRGLWLYDATAVKWRQTEVRFPPMPSTENCVGEIFRDGKLYMTSGSMGLVSVQPGNPFIVTPVGLDRDDGLPSDESGVITKVRADFNWLLALVDATTISDSDEIWSGLMGPFDTFDWSSEAGVLTLRAYSGGWHTLWKSSGSATPGYILDVSNAYDTRRVYWGASGKVYCMDLPGSVYNPRFNPTPKFAVGPVEHITSWYEYGSDAQAKIQGHFFMACQDMTADEKVEVYYQTDLNEASWTLLDTITTSGKTTLKPGDAQGLQIRLIRFKFKLYRGSDASLTPKIEYWAADFLRVLPATYAFVVTIDLSKSYAGQTPTLMTKRLKDLANPDVTTRLIQFSFTDELETDPQTYYGRISRLQGQAETGMPLRGQGWYQMSFMVPYLGDAE